MGDLSKKCKVMEFIGQAFIRIPRKLFMLLFHGKGRERNVALVYLALLSEVYFAEGYVSLRKHVYLCKRGEYVGTVKRLAECVQVHDSTIRRGLEWLRKEELIEWEALEDGSRIRVCGYDLIVLPGEAAKAGNGTGLSTFHALEEAERSMGGRSMQYDRKTIQIKKKIR